MEWLISNSRFRWQFLTQYKTTRSTELLEALKKARQKTERETDKDKPEVQEHSDDESTASNLTVSTLRDRLRKQKLDKHEES